MHKSAVICYSLFSLLCFMLVFYVNSKKIYFLSIFTGVCQINFNLPKRDTVENEIILKQQNKHDLIEFIKITDHTHDFLILLILHY